MGSVSADQLFTSIVSIAAPLGGVVVVMAALWVLLRTMSLHVLRGRAWRLVHGRSEVKDPDIKRFIDDRADLMSFRFISGVKTQTVEQSRMLVRWLRAHNVDVSAIEAVGPFFDLDAMRVKVHLLPKAGKQAASYILGALLVLLVPIPVKGLLAEQALVKLKSGDQWLAVTATTVTAMTWPPSQPRESLTGPLCSADKLAVAQRTLIDQNSLTELCDILKSPTTPKEVADIVQGQRVASILLVLLLVIPSYRLLRHALWADAARRLATTLETKVTTLRARCDRAT